MQPGTYPEASGLQVGTKSPSDAAELRDDEFADNFITPDVPAAAPVASRPSLPGPLPLGVGRPIQTAKQGELNAALAEAERGGRYMVVVYTVSPQPGAGENQPDRLDMRLFTTNFPKGDFGECVNLLQRQLTKLLDQK